MTECLVTVCGQCDPARRGRLLLRGCAFDVDAVMSQSSVGKQLLHRIQASESECSVVLLVGTNLRNTANLLCIGFCEQSVTSSNAFYRFSVRVGDPLNDDCSTFECERLADVESLLSGSEEAHTIAVTVTSTVATAASFTFTELCLVVNIVSCSDRCEELAKMVDSLAHQLRVSPRLVICHVQVPDEKSLEYCLRFRSDCPSETFGLTPSVVWPNRLRDVRSWARKIAESNRFTPSEPGSYFINLHPTPCVGDRIAHCIAIGESFIVSKPSEASEFDFCLSLADSLESVWSPHCRLRREDGRTTIAPECGLSYVNGQLLTEAVELHHNDRVALGSEVMLRFAVVQETRGKRWKHTVDWESAVKELHPPAQATLAAECEHESVIADLQLRLQRRTCGASLILTNPPEAFSESCVWSLGELQVGETIGIGHNQTIHVPQMKMRAFLTKTDDAYVLTCGSTSKRLCHASRFVVGDFLFLVNDLSCARAAPDKVSPSAALRDAGALSFSPTAFTELRNSLFDLQWSASALFDFAFPVDAATPDVHKSRRAALASDDILVGDHVGAVQINSTVQRITEALHMIGTQVADELNGSSECVNMSLLRVLHDRNRTIEQLLLGVDSSAPVAWAQVDSLSKSLGRRLVQVDAIVNHGSNRNSVDPPAVDVTGVSNLGQTASHKSLTAELQTLKSLAIVPTPIVGRRIASTIETISRSTNVRQLWDRYCREADAAVGTNGGVHSILPTKQQSVLLSVLDVVLAFEAGCRQGWIVQGDRAFVERRLAQWLLVVEHCAGSFSRPASEHRLLVASSPRSYAASTASSRQLSPAVSRSSSKERRPQSTSRQPSPVAKIAGRTPSPLSRPSLLTSPATYHVTRRATPESNSSRPLSSRPLSSRPAVAHRDVRDPVAYVSRQVNRAPTIARAASPKVALTKQLLEMDLKSKKRY